MCDAIWIGEEYWTTISNDGSLLGDRTVKDFLTFQAVHLKVPMDKAYVAFWIMYDELGHYETFGHAYLVQNGVCARFADRKQKARTICGGFRVLSRSVNSGDLGFKFVQAGQANIHEAIEYRNRQVAQIVSWTKNEAWYGSACMREAYAEGVNYENTYVKISYIDDPFFYRQNVYILVRCSPDDPKAGKSPYYTYHHTPDENHQLDQVQQSSLKQHQRMLRHKKQKEHKNEEQIGFAQKYYEQSYPLQNDDTHHPLMDDEPDEKWKFYRHLRSL
uniref:Neprosin domain-containing protein n=1 Tax=Setaria digitata TaxID=48799 RepID=A0A915Q0D6_9BILA